MLSLLVALLVHIGLMGCLVSNIRLGNLFMIDGPVLVADTLTLIFYLVFMAIEVALTALSL